MKENSSGRKARAERPEFLAAFKDNLRRIESLLGWELGHQTECCGVSLTQRLVVLELGRRDRTSLVELAQTLGLDASTLSRSINGLVNIGLVRRDVNSADRRYISLSLTAQGREVRERIEEASDAYFKRVFEKIPMSSHQTILKSISLLTEALLSIGQESRDVEARSDQGTR